MTTQGEVRDLRRVWTWLRACLPCLFLVAACETSEPTLTLGPLPIRRDAGVSQDGADPDGAVRCVRDAQCDDDIECTRDVCFEGYCRFAIHHAACADGVFCNGDEICVAQEGCKPGAPRVCRDRSTCTLDRCDEDAKACVYAPRDLDEDGEADFRCEGGTDCNDFDDAVGRFAAERCGDGIDNDCDLAIDEETCGRPDHDSCADALDVSAGGTFDVDVRGAVRDYVLSCDTQSAKDAVFTFRVPASRDVYVEARGLLNDGVEEVATVALFSACGEPNAEQQCTQGFPADLRARALPRGRYSLVVSSPGAARISLSIRFSTPTNAPTNTSCEDAIDVSGGGRFSADFIDVGDHLTHACSTDGRPDLFYAFTLDEPRNVDLSAISPEGGALTLSVRTSCADAADVLRCDSSAAVQSRFYALQAGTYVLVVEGPATREIPFVLSVSFSPATPPPQGDGCDDPLAVNIGRGMRVTLGDKTDDLSASCGLGGADAVLRLQVPRPMDLELELDSGGVLASVAFGEACSDVASELVCRRGSRIASRLRDVAQGVYYVAVDAPGSSAITLDVDELPRTQPVVVTESDGCPNAFELPESGGLFRGDTRELRDRHRGPCSAGGAARDATFRLQLTETRRVRMRLEASFEAVVYRYASDLELTSGCDEAEAVRCADDSGPDDVTVLDEALGPGAYFYVVDGFRDGQEGPYVLDVAISPP